MSEEELKSNAMYWAGYVIFIGVSLLGVLPFFAKAEAKLTLLIILCTVYTLFGVILHYFIN